MLKRDFIDGISLCTLTDKTGKACISFLPEFGATPVALGLLHRAKTIQIFDGFQTEEQIRANDKSRGIFLLPFPNRIQNGSYVFNGKKYQLPLNKPKENNAIHGFMWNRSFQLQEKENAVKLTHSYAGDYPGFPFPFATSIQYDISVASCIVETGLTNTGDSPMPLGIGWHPYFILQKPVDDLSLQLPLCNHLAIGERMIPTGVRTPFTEFLTAQNIGNRNFDDAFECVGENDFYETRLSDSQSGLTIILRQDSVFKYLQVYTPPCRNSIALEPMTCPANAFNSGEGLIVLQPGQSCSGKITIAISG